MDEIPGSDGSVFLLDDRPFFPPPERARSDGLLAVGGDLSIPRLLKAYRCGIFPWYEEGDPILWWSPDPRLILEPADLRVSRSLRSTIRKGVFQIRFDTAFDEVVLACASILRPRQEGTWIGLAMRSAYGVLHQLGYAHSVESWHEGKLVGGLYGVYLGGCFFGESMFSSMTDASKVALVALIDFLMVKDIKLIDCQVSNDHLLSLGAKEISRSLFLRRLEEGIRSPVDRSRWTKQ
jgi:leucyl/phenylalanyl-tRNA--protein transferase